jgi:hypothetical protein
MHLKEGHRSLTRDFRRKLSLFSALSFLFASILCSRPISSSKMDIQSILETKSSEDIVDTASFDDNKSAERYSSKCSQEKQTGLRKRLNFEHMLIYGYKCIIFNGQKT